MYDPDYWKFSNEDGKLERCDMKQFKADLNADQFRLGTGTVQCYILRPAPFTAIHYGRAEYLRENRIMTDSLREQGQKVCDALRLIDETEARLRLKQIYW